MHSFDDNTNFLPAIQKRQSLSASCSIAAVAVSIRYLPFGQSSHDLLRSVQLIQNNKLFDSEFNLFDTIHTRIDMREFYPAAMFRRSFHESRDIFEVYL